MILMVTDRVVFVLPAPCEFRRCTLIFCCENGNKGKINRLCFHGKTATSCRSFGSAFLYFFIEMLHIPQVFCRDVKNDRSQALKRDF